MEGGDDMTLAPENDTPSAIVSHDFEPRGAWWTPCRICKMAEAAHARTTLPTPAVVPVVELKGAWCATPSVVQAMREAGEL